jgi:predicted MPP superfamily phosphohydrolase
MEGKLLLLALTGLSVIFYIGVQILDHSERSGVQTPAQSLRQNPTQLKFNANHEFTILQFTDLHYGKDAAANSKTSEVQAFLINLVQPDMIVVTGDAVSGNDWDGKTPDFFKNLWYEFTGPYRNLQVPYAYAFGNHDTDADLKGPEIGALDQTHPQSLFNGTSDIDPMGFSNYVLKVKSSYPGLEDRNAGLLWIFDTKKENCMDMENSWGCITQNQIDWFKNTSDTLKKTDGSRVDGLAFFHIPIPEYMNMWNEAMTYSNKNASVSCPRVNTQAFEAFLENSSIRATFCGHDHTNDFGGNYKGVELVYGRKTGYGAKGPDGLKGARVIKLKEKLNKSETEVEIEYSHMIVDEYGSFYENPEPKWQGGDKQQTVCDFYK